MCQLQLCLLLQIAVLIIGTSAEGAGWNTPLPLQSREITLNNMDPLFRYKQEGYDSTKGWVASYTGTYPSPDGPSVFSNDNTAHRTQLGGTLVGLDFVGKNPKYLGGTYSSNNIGKMLSGPTQVMRDIWGAFPRMTLGDFTSDNMDFFQHQFVVETGDFMFFEAKYTIEYPSHTYVSRAQPCLIVQPTSRPTFHQVSPERR